MRGTRWGRRQHWAIVLLAACTTGIAGATVLGAWGAATGVILMAIAW